MSKSLADLVLGTGNLEITYTPYKIPTKVIRFGYTS